jgi:hypothetical protein
VLGSFTWFMTGIHCDFCHILSYEIIEMIKHIDN